MIPTVEMPEGAGAEARPPLRGPADEGTPQALLLGAFYAGLAAVASERVVPPALPSPPAGRTLVVGAGKASAAMARALETHWKGDLSGLVVVPHGYATHCERIEIVEAAHPIPDDVGSAAARRMLALAGEMTADDLMVALFSGGGSALLPLPAPGLTLDDKRSVTGQLLRAGAPIADINCLRKHLSAIKGGRLACAAAPAPVVNLLISDVAGDDPSLIASGPAVADPSTLAEARAVLERYGISVSAAVRNHLSREEAETPKPDHPGVARVSVRIVASAQTFLEAASDWLAARGLPAFVLSDSIEGEARQVALVHAALGRQIARRGQPFAPPCVLLSGGETTVTVRGEGRGGPNLEFLLALLLGLGDSARFAALACDTDGSDGSSGVAGALLHPDTFQRAREAGLDARRALDTNDSERFFAALGDSIVSGPTLNNVNDFRALLVLPEGGTAGQNVAD